MIMDQVYSTSKERIKTLEEYPFSLELSQVGGYMDEFKMNDLISCYKCDLKLPWPEIKKLSDSLDITFLKAAWLFHAKSNPWCELLKDKAGKFLRLKCC